MRKIFVPLSIIVAVFVSGTARAVDQPSGPPPVQGACMTVSGHQPPPNGMMLLMNCIEVNVLAELTGQPRENVRMMLVCAPVPAVLNQYGIDPKDFFAAMDRQTGKLVTQAASGSIISRKQAEDIQKRMSAGRIMHGE